MKLIPKTVLIIAGALVLLGVILAVTAISMGGITTKSLSTGKPYEEKVYTYDSDKVKKLSVSDVSNEIVVTGSSQSGITIKCYENDTDYYKISLTDDGNLSVVRQISNRWYENINIGLNIREDKLTITVPSDLAAAIDITSVSSKANLSNLDKAEKLSVKTTSGNIRLNKISSSGNMSLDSVSGNIELDSVKIDGILNLKTTSGKIETSFADISGDILSSTLSGKINFRNTNAKGNVSAESVSGGVTLDRLGGADFSVKTTSGDVKGIISGNPNDYRIESYSTSGKINLPRSQSGGKLLKVSTTSGSIDIKSIS